MWYMWLIGNLIWIYKTISCRSVFYSSIFQPGLSAPMGLPDWQGTLRWCNRKKCCLYQGHPSPCHRLETAPEFSEQFFISTSCFHWCIFSLYGVQAMSARYGTIHPAVNAGAINQFVCTCRSSHRTSNNDQVLRVHNISCNVIINNLHNVNHNHPFLEPKLEHALVCRWSCMKEGKEKEQEIFRAKSTRRFRTSLFLLNLHHLRNCSIFIFPWWTTPVVWCWASVWQKSLRVSFSRCPVAQKIHASLDIVLKARLFNWLHSKAKLAYFDAEQIL